MDRISLDERQTKKITEMSALRNKKELKYFLAATNFFCKWLLRYSVLIELFAKLYKKIVKLSGT